MDSLTQALLGAAVGFAAAPGRGRRAMAYGAAAGVLPDLDVLASPFMSEVEAFVTHRSATHSLVIMPLVALALAHILSRIRTAGLSRGEWLRLLTLCFVTHFLLDLCTSYGTQIFWPLSRHPYAWSVVFIIDPAYSLMLTVGLVVAWRARRHGAARRAISVALLASTVYLALAAAFKLQASRIFAAELEARGIPPLHFKTQNTPFNILMWDALVVGDGFIAHGHCIFPCDPDGVEFRITPFSEHRAAVESWKPEFAELRMLADFSRGFYQIRQIGSDIVLVDLRFGSGNVRPFAFRVGRVTDRGPEPAGPHAQRVRMGSPEDFRREFGKFFSRWR